MRALSRLGTEPAYKTNNDTIHNAFRLVRHYIGRLGYHFQAANILLSCALRFLKLFNSYKVYAISTPSKFVLPPAEIQVLEHFFANKFSFVGIDPFIACSKPACSCCLLYFRNHPGHFVEPALHHKIYLSDLSTIKRLASA
jgi:hypothetical protein